MPLKFNIHLEKFNFSTSGFKSSSVKNISILMDIERFGRTTDPYVSSSIWTECLKINKLILSLDEDLLFKSKDINLNFEASTNPLKMPKVVCLIILL